MLSNQEHAYLIFGVEDGSHKITGTKVRLKSEKVGGELFANWLARKLEPRLTLEFEEVELDGKHAELVVINPAYDRPVRFDGKEYIRVESVLKELKDYPERARSLWNLTSRFAFEQGTAAHHYSPQQILDSFFCESLFRLMGKPKPSPTTIIDQLEMDRLIVDDKQGGFDVTNLFALVAAKDLTAFPSVESKAPRLIVYTGKDRLVGSTDIVGRFGYAVAFTRLISRILSAIPKSEEMRHGLRHTAYAFPELAIREFLANALVHQDLTSKGRPTIEIFSDRIEFTNQGAPLISLERLIDAPPRSRNEKLVAYLRQLKICEDRGSGVDRALDAIESESLPPPLFQVVEEATKVTIFNTQPFANMSKEDRLRAAYQHACLKYESHQEMTNSSLRTRFGLPQRQYPQVSNVIRDAIEAGLIKPYDVDQANRNAKYVPHWA